MGKRFSFDEHYYQRYYGDERTRVTTPQSVAKLGNFVCAYLKHLGQPVRRVVDLGCGLGYWRAVIRRHFPKASYLGVEVSEHLCRTRGWAQGSVVDFASDQPFDLVICQGVLQYLGAAAAKRALRNLRRLCRGALYLEVLTIEDWQRVCDQRVTDGSGYLRTAAWYRRELERRFVPCGGGVFLADPSPVRLFALERGW